MSNLLYKSLVRSKLPDIMFNYSVSTRNGNKISIQGKSINDSKFLYDRLFKYLDHNKIPFKIATNTRYMSKHKEQRYKAMTIYCPDNYDFQTLCEDVYTRIIDYKGWYDIKTPKSYKPYAGGVFFRNDRDEYGNYIPAN